MKALKQKTGGLRTLIRNGAAILAAAAVAFAAVSCAGGDEADPAGGSQGGGSQTDSGGGLTGGGQPSGPSQANEGEAGEGEAAQWVKHITVRSQPTSWSYLGQKPNLTGMVIEATWTDGVKDWVQIYSGNEVANNFYTDPARCEQTNGFVLNAPVDLTTNPPSITAGTEIWFLTSGVSVFGHEIEFGDHDGNPATPNQIYSIQGIYSSPSYRIYHNSSQGADAGDDLIVPYVAPLFDSRSVLDNGIVPPADGSIRPNSTPTNLAYAHGRFNDGQFLPYQSKNVDFFEDQDFDADGLDVMAFYALVPQYNPANVVNVVTTTAANLANAAPGTVIGQPGGFPTPGTNGNDDKYFGTDLLSRVVVPPIQNRPTSPQYTLPQWGPGDNVTMQAAYRDRETRNFKVLPDRKYWSLNAPNTASGSASNRRAWYSVASLGNVYDETEAGNWNNNNTGTGSTGTWLDAHKTVEFSYNNYWLVDKFEYVAGSGTIGTFKYTAEDARGVSRLEGDAGTLVKRQYWINQLLAGNPQFKVTYLNAPESSTRTIGIGDVIAASARRNPRADKALNTPSVAIVPPRLDAVYDDNTAVIRIQYYDAGITLDPNAAGVSVRGAGVPAASSERPNQAVIPLKVYMYDGDLDFQYIDPRNLTVDVMGRKRNTPPKLQIFDWADEVKLHYKLVYVHRLYGGTEVLDPPLEVTMGNVRSVPVAPGANGDLSRQPAAWNAARQTTSGHVNYDPTGLIVDATNTRGADINDEDDPSDEEFNLSVLPFGGRSFGQRANRTYQPQSVTVPYRIMP